MEAPLNTLVYKRTHTGDPDESGVFGVDDCMGRVRGWRYDAVIGVGGRRPQSDCEGIARRINWIGIGPTRELVPPKGFRGPRVTFEYFRLWKEDEEDGKLLNGLAPTLSEHLFKDNKHFVMSMSPKIPIEIRDEIQREIQEIFRWARDNPSKLACRGNLIVALPAVCKTRIPTKRKCGTGCSELGPIVGRKQLRGRDPATVRV